MTDQTLDAVSNYKPISKITNQQTKIMELSDSDPNRTKNGHQQKPTTLLRTCSSTHTKIEISGLSQNFYFGCFWPKLLEIWKYVMLLGIKYNSEQKNSVCTHWAIKEQKIEFLSGKAQRIPNLSIFDETRLVTSIPIQQHVKIRSIFSIAFGQFGRSKNS